MSDSGLYRERLLEHYHHPRNRGDVVGMARVRRGSNPRCGDEVEVGVDVDGAHVTAVRFRGRGCSVCIASASMMTEAVRGLDAGEALSLGAAMAAWFGADPGSPPPAALPESLLPLVPAQAHPARRRCALLAWEALAEALR